jgi:molecular chaperone DnaK
VEIRVYQGEHHLAAGNQPLGSFFLHNLPPAPRGAPQIEVTFALDASGLLEVSAVDRASGRARQLTIDSKTAQVLAADASTTLQDSAAAKLGNTALVVVDQ